MKRSFRTILFMFICAFFAATALSRFTAAFTENKTSAGYADALSVPTLDTAGPVVSVSETDQALLTRLFSAANPSDLLASFTYGEQIDHMMWIAGFAAGYGSEEADFGPVETDPCFGEAAQTYFAGLWDTYFDGWDLKDETNQPPADILPYSTDGSVGDSVYYRVKNEFLQTSIKGIFGREMASPEAHVRYFDGYFYFGHIGDVEERLWFGYDYTIDNIYDLSDGYYKAEGKATYFHYATGEPEESRAYEAIVKRDAAADYAYFLLSQRFGDAVNTPYDTHAQESGNPSALSAVNAADTVLKHTAGRTFSFLSGVGGWMTEMTLAEDGSFTGTYHDWDMGDTGDDYPMGTRYECLFKGMFEVTGQPDAYTYELKLTMLFLRDEPGEESIENGARIITDEPYGLVGGNTFMLYCPGRATGDLPEDFLMWVRMPHAWDTIPDELPFYGLYHVGEGFGFFSDMEP